MWSSDRIQNVLQALVSQGICWIDIQFETTEYWVMSLWASNRL
jgi:hypothetical protein